MQRTAAGTALLDPQRGGAQRLVRVAFRDGCTLKTNVSPVDSRSRRANCHDRSRQACKRPAATKMSIIFN
jgi:hypothetical protein